MPPLKDFRRDGASPGILPGIGIKFLDDASFQVEPLKSLEAKKDYIIKINFSKLTDAAGNKLGLSLPV